MLTEFQSPACDGCGDWVTFTATVEQFARWKQGGHVQLIFPDWSPEDRERLISGTCPSCWEEMWAEEEEDEWEDEEAFYTTMELLDPESSFPEYEPDWYVD